MHEQEIIDEALIETLEECSEQILQGVLAAENEYILALPDGRGLDGSVGFWKVENVEFGYRAPDWAMRVLLPAERAYEWRG